MPPLEIHVLQPSMTQSSPSRTARDVIAATSEPASGSDSANAAIALPCATSASQCSGRMLVALDGERDRPGAEALHRECEIGKTVVPGERFAQHAQRARIDARRRAAEARRNAVAQQARRAERSDVAPADRVDVGLDVVVLGCEAVRAADLRFGLQPLQCADRPAIGVRGQRAMRVHRRTASRNARGPSSRSLDYPPHFVLRG